MQHLFHIGVALCVLGLIGTHIVTFATRGSRRERKGIKKSLNIMMWASPGAALVGFALLAVWYFLR